MVTGRCPRALFPAPSGYLHGAHDGLLHLLAHNRWMVDCRFSIRAAWCFAAALRQTPGSPAGAGLAVVQLCAAAGVRWSSNWLWSIRQLSTTLFTATSILSWRCSQTASDRTASGPGLYPAFRLLHHGVMISLGDVLFKSRRFLGRNRIGQVLQGAVSSAGASQQIFALNTSAALPMT